MEKQPKMYNLYHVTATEKALLIILVKLWWVSAKLLVIKKYQIFQTREPLLNCTSGVKELTRQVSLKKLLMKFLATNHSTLYAQWKRKPMHFFNFLNYYTIRVRKFYIIGKCGISRNYFAKKNLQKTLQHYTVHFSYWYFAA